MKILFKLASRSRPDKFFVCLKNIIEKVSDKENYQVMVSYDYDDETMQHEKIRDKLLEIVEMIKSEKRILMCFGESKNKIAAINRDIDSYPQWVNPWNILINTSDDMLFIKEGFDNIIRQDMNTYFPDLDGVLHYPDQNQGASCMSMSIMGRKYYERDNFIYDPRFESLWCDIVAQEVAQLRGKYKFIDRKLFEHHHPSFRQAEYDEQYRKTESMEVRIRDYNTYLQLKKEYDPNNVFTIRGL